MTEGPLYMEIYKNILENIRSRKWKENDPLPAERALCQCYHVSRATVRRALECLERDNYIFKKHGNGNFVKPQVYEQPLVTFYSFTDSLKKNGVIIENKIVNYTTCKADDEFSKATGFKSGEVLHQLTRLRSAQNYPLMLEVTYLPQSRFFLLDIDTLGAGSLYDYLTSRYDMRVEQSIEEFFPVMAGQKERQLLQIPANLPCMALERKNYEAGELIEYTKSLVRGDKYKFKVELTIPNGHDLGGEYGDDNKKRYSIL